MNRRNFFKVVTGFVAGIFATSAEGKKRSGTRYCGEASTGIDPNSEWAKQKPLTLSDIIKAKKELKSGPPGPTEIPAIWSVWCQDDTKTIQEAIDLAAKDGGVVYFPKGTYNLKYGIIV